MIGGRTATRRSAKTRGAAKQRQSTEALERDRVRRRSPVKGAATRPGPPSGAPASCAKPGHPDPQSQSLSRSYGSNLPTSLTYIILSTRGCSPWRPAADMGTSWCESPLPPPDFQGPTGRARMPRELRHSSPTKTHSPCERIPGSRWLMQKRQLFPAFQWASPSRVALPRRIRGSGRIRYQVLEYEPVSLSAELRRYPTAHIS